MNKEKDKQIDIPSEANREKHINFLEAEERTSGNKSSDKERFGHTDEDEKRREQWQKGLREGEEAKNSNT